MKNLKMKAARAGKDLKQFQQLKKGIIIRR